MFLLESDSYLVTAAVTGHFVSTERVDLLDCRDRLAVAAVPTGPRWHGHSLTTRSSKRLLTL